MATPPPSGDRFFTPIPTSNDLPTDQNAKVQNKYESGIAAHERPMAPPLPKPLAHVPNLQPMQPPSQHSTVHETTRTLPAVPANILPLGSENPITGILDSKRSITEKQSEICRHYEIKTDNKNTRAVLAEILAALNPPNTASLHDILTSKSYLAMMSKEYDGTEQRARHIDFAIDITRYIRDEIASSTAEAPREHLPTQAAPLQHEGAATVTPQHRAYVLEAIAGQTPPGPLRDALSLRYKNMTGESLPSSKPMAPSTPVLMGDVDEEEERPDSRGAAAGQSIGDAKYKVIIEATIGEKPKKDQLTSKEFKALVTALRGAKTGVAANTLVTAYVHAHQAHEKIIAVAILMAANPGISEKEAFEHVNALTQSQLESKAVGHGLHRVNETLNIKHRYHNQSDQPFVNCYSHSPHAKNVFSGTSEATGKHGSLSLGYVRHASPYHENQSVAYQRILEQVQTAYDVHLSRGGVPGHFKIASIDLMSSVLVGGKKDDGSKILQQRMLLQKIAREGFIHTDGTSVKVTVRSYNFPVNAGATTPVLKSVMRVVSKYEKENGTNIGELLEEALPRNVQHLGEVEQKAIAALRAQIQKTPTVEPLASDPYALPARVALLESLLSGVPMFNCKSGKDRTSQLATEIQFAEWHFAQYGDFPTPGAPLKPADQAMLRQIALTNGNSEIQERNVGVPGSKTGGQVDDHMFSPGLQALCTWAAKDTSRAEQLHEPLTTKVLVALTIGNPELKKLSDEIRSAASPKTVSDFDVASEIASTLIGLQKEFPNVSFGEMNNRWKLLYYGGSSTVGD